MIFNVTVLSKTSSLYLTARRARNEKKAEGDVVDLN